MVRLTRSPLLAQLALLALLPVSVLSIGHVPCVAYSKASTFSFPLVASGKAATILTSADDWPGVNQIAITNFASDVGKVTGHIPTVKNVTATSLSKSAAPLIIVGTLDKSSLINSLSNSSSIIANITSTLRGQWESYTALPITLPNVGQAYVLIGSDKRGTIYGLYELSEQVSNSVFFFFDSVDTRSHYSHVLDWSLTVVVVGRRSCSKTQQSLPLLMLPWTS